MSREQKQDWAAKIEQIKQQNEEARKNLGKPTIINRDKSKGIWVVR